MVQSGGPGAKDCTPRPGVDLSGCNFAGANLSGTNLSDTTVDGVKSGGIVGIPVPPPDPWLFFPLNGSAGGYLVGPYANLSGADLNGATLTGANLTRANLTTAHLAGANLTDVQTHALNGVPASLPTGWVLQDGCLVQVSAPGAPAITGLSNGDGQVSVGFSDSDSGTSPITSFQVTATARSQPAASPVTATGPSSPILVTGLTNGGTYVFTVTATNAGGASPSSVPSGALNVGVAPAFGIGPANGVAGQAYSSGFTVTGAPAPAVTQFSGDLPPGLTLNSDGKLTGTPTQAGSYEFTVEAVNNVGITGDTVTVTISPP